jgi:site-specific recombinase XerD
MPVERRAEVLSDIGMLDDDRPGTLDRAFSLLLKDVAPVIRSDVQDWLTVLLEGTPRAKPRSRATVGEYLRATAPVLTAWSASHSHLREITADELRQSIAALPAGSPRTQALVALRSLFRYLRAQRRVFRNPAARLNPGPAKTAVLLPLAADDYQLAIAAAATPEHRLALVLAAVLAARPGEIRALELDDVDHSARRITIAGHARRLDDLSCQVIEGYLAHRRSQWPQTANPHLLVSKQTAKDTRPVTDYYIGQLFKGQGATLDRVRSDRWLEEALSRGPDPLHLSAVFGISASTAMRYAQAARSILESEHANDAGGIRPCPAKIVTVGDHPPRQFC